MKVVELKTSPPNRAKITESLERHLERSKAGTYIAAALVFVKEDGDIVWCHTTPDRQKLIGAIEIMKLDIAGSLKGD